MVASFFAARSSNRHQNKMNSNKEEQIIPTDISRAEQSREEQSRIYNIEQSRSEERTRTQQDELEQKSRTATQSKTGTNSR